MTILYSTFYKILLNFQQNKIPLFFNENFQTFQLYNDVIFVNMNFLVTW